MTQIDPETRLTRGATAEALTARGYPMTKGTLNTKASRGEGPPYCLWGRNALYRWGDALDWAERRLSAQRCGISESQTTQFLTAA